MLSFKNLIKVHKHHKSEIMLYEFPLNKKTFLVAEKNILYLV